MMVRNRNFSRGDGVYCASKLQFNSCSWKINGLQREDSTIVKSKGLRKCFQLGGTSACRVHARTHYTKYAKRCKGAGVPEHHWAVPRKIQKQRVNEAENNLNGDTGQLLSKGFKPLPQFRGPEKFSKESVLENVAKFIVCTDQVSKDVSSSRTHHSPRTHSPLLLLEISSFATVLFQCVLSQRVTSFPVPIKSQIISTTSSSKQ